MGVIVNWIGTGNENDPRRADLPQGVSYTVLHDNGDGTVAVQPGPEYEMVMMQETIDTLTLALLELEP
jgi:hypothetical protein